MSTDFEESAREIMVALVPTGGAYAITYRRKGGAIVSTYGVRDKTVDAFGNFESTTSEWRNVWDLLTEDLGDAPCRGDTIIDSDGLNWSVQDILEGDSDEEIVRVTVV